MPAANTTPAGAFPSAPTAAIANLIAAIDDNLEAEAVALRAGDAAALERAERAKEALARDLAGSLLAAADAVRIQARRDIIQIVVRAEANRARRLADAPTS